MKIILGDIESIIIIGIYLIGAILSSIVTYKYATQIIENEEKAGLRRYKRCSKEDERLFTTMCGGLLSIIGLFICLPYIVGYFEKKFAK